MINITIIGAGQIGSRHLQALTNLDEKKYSIFVIDPTQNSLNTAKQRFKELRPEDTMVTYSTSLEKLPLEIEVAIIATGSLVRRKIIFELLNGRKVKYVILEKFLFPAISDYNEVAELLKSTGTKAFVNCARRMWDLYKDVKIYMNGSLRFEAVGNQWGMGSNGVHMIDIFSYLINDEAILLNGTGLDPKLHESKREGYVEFTGLVNGSTKKGHKFTIISHDEVASPLTLFLSNSTHRIIIKEEGAKATLLVSSLKNQWKWQEKVFDIQFQSNLSHLFVTDLVENKTCDLPSYELSANLHTSILAIFLDRMSETLNKKITLCPIT